MSTSSELASASLITPQRVSSTSSTPSLTPAEASIENGSTPSLIPVDPSLPNDPATESLPDPAASINVVDPTQQEDEKIFSNEEGIVIDLTTATPVSSPEKPTKANPIYTFNHDWELTPGPRKKKAPNLPGFPSKESLYRNSDPPKCFLEIPLQHFQSWCKDLRLSSLLKIADSGPTRWAFALWFLFPCHSVLDSIKSDKIQIKNLSFAKRLVHQFYDSIFDMHVEDKKAREHDINKDLTVMMVAHVRGANEAKCRYIVNVNEKQIHVLSAITFRHTPHSVTQPDPDGVNAIILWMGATDDIITPVRPSELTSWKRQGLGTFMIIHVIKRCVCIQELKPDKEAPVSVFLQATMPDAIHFYHSLGFIVMTDDPTDDGLHLLPKNLNLAILQDLEFTWIAYDPEQPHLPALLLLALPAGKFPTLPPLAMQSSISRKGNLRPASIPRSDASVYWVEYPPLNGIMYNESDFDTAMKDLHVLSEFLPKQDFPPVHLLPRASMKIHGCLKTVQREEHLKSSKTWFASSEMDLMLSILLRDGRYDSSVSVISLSTSCLISEAMKAHCEYDKIMAFYKSELVKGSSTEDDINEECRKRFKETPETISKRYTNHINKVLRSATYKDSGIFYKRVIVLPNNERNQHWTATFVFNASSINNDTDPGGLQPCFFHYDPFAPDGSNPVKSNNGLIWFLNLLYSAHKQQQQSVLTCNAGLQWLFPFGPSKPNTQNYGTQKFPQLILKNEKFLPKQTDTWNCGLGTVAAIAIILRDVVGGTRVAFDKFKNCFERQKFNAAAANQVGKINFPSKLLKGLPKPVSKDDDYLHQTRKEWLQLFERMAQLNHEIIIHRLNPSAIIDPMFLNLFVEPLFDFNDPVMSWKPKVNLTKTKMVSDESQVASVLASMSGAAIPPKEIPVEDETLKPKGTKTDPKAKPKRKKEESRNKRML